MKKNQLASKKNLELAWRRITTGGNYQYKRFYRPIDYAYEVALDANLADLRNRLVGGVFQPQHPERIYVPKTSGLHRPLTLLNIEDQIILQAFANLAAKRMQKKRGPLQFKFVFSNILRNPKASFSFGAGRTRTERSSDESRNTTAAACDGLGTSTSPRSTTPFNTSFF